MTENGQTVTLAVTYYVEVPVTKDGPGQPALDVTYPVAEDIVLNAMHSRDWGGYSMLGKAFQAAGLDPWKASNMRVVRTAADNIDTRTQAEKLAADMRRIREQQGTTGVGPIDTAELEHMLQGDPWKEQ